MNEEKMINVFGTAGCIAKDRLWFVVGQFNILCGFNLISKVIDRIEIIPYEVELVGEDNIFIQLLPQDDYLYLIPMVECGKYGVIRYNISTTQFDAFQKSEIKGAHSNLLYSGASMVDQKLYCILWKGLYAYSYDFAGKTESLVFATNFDEDIESISLHHTIIGEDGVIYSTVQGTDKIIVFNAKECKSEIIELGIGKCFAYPRIAYMGDYLYWFSNRGGDAVYKYDLKQKKLVAKCDIGADHTYMFALCNKYLVCDMGVEKKYRIYNSDFELLTEGEKRTSDVGNWYSYGEIIVRMNASDFKIEIFENLNMVETYPIKIPYKYVDEANKFLKIYRCNEYGLVGLEYFIDNIVKG